MDLDKEEELYLAVFCNAIEKLIASVIIYSSGKSYSSAYFLAVISQEEAAKFIILPFSIELNEEEIFLSNRTSTYFNHRFKQKIFTTWGMQNRSHDGLEDMKQSLLYVGNSKKLRQDISAEETYKEIKIAARFLVRKILLDVDNTDKFSKDFKETIREKSFALRDVLLELIPKLKQDMLEEEEMRYNKIKIKGETAVQEQNIREMFSNPFILIVVFRTVFKEEYQEHIRAINKMTFDEMVQYFIDEYNGLEK